MSYLNQSQLIGHLGVDPKLLKKTEQGLFVRISLATNKKYTDSYGESCVDCQWHTVYLNGSAAKFALEYAHKGDNVFISGELRTKKWTDKKTGEERYETAIYSRDLQLLTSKSKDQTSEPDENSETSPVSEKKSEQTDVSDKSGTEAEDKATNMPTADDIPF